MTRTVSVLLTAVLVAGCSSSTSGDGDQSQAKPRRSAAPHHKPKGSDPVALVRQRYKPCLARLHATKLTASGQNVVATVPGTILTWQVRRFKGKVYTSPDADTARALGKVGC